MSADVPYVEIANTEAVHISGDDDDKSSTSSGLYQSCESNDSYVTASLQSTRADSPTFPIISIMKAIAGSNIVWAIYVLTLCSAFFIIVYIIGRQQPGSVTAEIVLTSFMIIGFIGQVLCLIRKANPAFVRFKPLESRHSNNYLMAGVYIFGSGTLLVVILRLQVYYHAWQLVQSCQSGVLSNKEIVPVFKSGLKSSNTTNEHLVGVFCYSDIIYDVVRVFFTLLQIAFLQTFHTATFSESIKIKFILYHTMLTNVCIWIKYVVEETHLFGKAGHHSFSNLDSTVKRCISIIEILTPFILEYSLIVAGILHEISCQMKMFRSSTSARSAEEPSGLSSMFTAPKERHMETSNNGFNISTAFELQSGSQPGMIFGILFALLIVSTAILSEGSNSTPNGRSLILFTVIEASLFTLQLLALFVLLMQLRFHKSHQHQIRPDDFLLIVGFIIGMCVFSLVGIYTNVKCCTEKYHPSMLHVADVVNTIQIVLNLVAQLFQTIVITVSRRFSPKQSNNKSRYSAGRIRQLALLLLTINLGLWAVDSFIEIKNSARSSFPCSHVVFRDSWDTIVAITYPFAIFYRFHSAAMFFEFWARFKYEQRSD